MKITSEQLLPTLNNVKSEPVENSDSAAIAGQKSPGQGADRVELSINKGEIEQLKKTMQAIPEVRNEKIARLKEAIDSGSYKVDGKEVAAKMIQSWREVNGRK
jgi:negative regulator of flagellin synthesis FlgM